MSSSSFVLSDGRKPRIGILCLSPIPDDPRVRRQGDLLTQDGWEVVAIGLPGHLSSMPTWTCLAIGDVGPSMPVSGSSGFDDETGYRKRIGRLRQAMRAPVSEGGGLRNVFAVIGDLVLRDPAALLWVIAKLPGMLARRVKRALGAAIPFPAVVRRQLQRARRVIEIARLSVQPTYGREVYWRLNDRFSRILELARPHKVDFWLANDWTTLPIAMRLAAEQGVSYGYDTHELAVDEYAQSALWRMSQRPVIAAVEKDGIAGAAFATCVSDGIADRLAEVYKLPVRPAVIRNTPMYSRQSFRATGARIDVLYHGVVAPGRGLEACIRSVALWRPEFHLTVRGPADPSYLAGLQKIAVKAGVVGRVIFDEPVPMTELVARAADFDVGLFALPDHSLQNVYVLPNKFFEYTMAGLALCVSDLPEMTRLLRRHDLGELIEAVTPEAIAAAVNRLDRPAIDRFKMNALAAAQELNWQAEGRKLLEACAANLRR
ncbi:MAG: hypothetical protein J0H01_21385 [Rhizobiales bacterium]|nr:hypothetical protein [Hyphomicrobiales bacterium]